MNSDAQCQGQEFISEVDELVSNVNALNDMYKKWFTADLNFFENCLKAVNALLPQQAADPPEQIDPSEVVFQLAKDLPQKFVKIQKELRDSTLPRLRDLLTSMSKYSHTFLSKATGITKDLRKKFNDFNAVRYRGKQKQKEQNLKVSIMGMVNDVGRKMNNLYSSFFADVSTSETCMIQVVTEFSSFLKECIEREKRIVSKAALLMFEVYGFNGEFSKMERKLNVYETVEFYVEQIPPAFYALRTAVSALPLSENHVVASDWKDDDDVFYARVWEGYKAKNNNEVTASRKSLVKVTKATMHSHWFVEKLNGNSGYFPCSYLEPVQD